MKRLALLRWIALFRQAFARVLNGLLLRPLRIAVVQEWDPEDAKPALGESQVLSKFLPHLPHFYVDIGASNGVFGSNTTPLAREGWSGVCFECDPLEFSRLARTVRHLDKVSPCCARVTPENVCLFFQAFGVPRELGLLSLDIDSYDAFVLEALLSQYRPSVIVAEINENIPPPLDFTVCYDPAFRYQPSHFFGQSLTHLAALGTRFGYALAHLEYNNAFLVLADRFPGVALTPLEAYRQGYLSRPDRKKHFPWDADMEPVLTMLPDEALAFLNGVFSKHKGQYLLTTQRP